MARKVTRQPDAGRKAKPACADCFFSRNGLCALELDSPCPTFRHHADGLRPPRQLAIVFRQDRVNTAWSFKQAA